RSSSRSPSGPFPIGAGFSRAVIVLGVYLLMNIPVTAEWVLGALLGIQLICEGAALAYLAWQVRSA
ncbi:MAG: hypothetical protein ABW031_00245, partial [Methyloceanibacter sp.]